MYPNIQRYVTPGKIILSKLLAFVIFLTVATAATASESTEKQKPFTEQQLLLETPPSSVRISIVNNQVIVPVKFWNKGRIIAARMILDTGASTTTIYAKLASELNLGKNELRRVKTTSANGSTTEALLTKVDMIEVGDKSQSDAAVIFMPTRSEIGVDGLLGSSFLRFYNFSIDYNNRLLRWN